MLAYSLSSLVFYLFMEGEQFVSLLIYGQDEHAMPGQTHCGSLS